MMRQMIAATGNAEKMVEIRQILAGSGIELETMDWSWRLLKTEAHLRKTR